MAPTRGLLRFTLATGSPPLVVRRRDTLTATPFGRWMLERVASAMLDWPALAFHRVELTVAGLEVVLIAGDQAPARAQFEAMATALARELDVAARRRRWSRGALWASVEVAVGGTRPLPSPAPSLREG